MLKQRIIPTCSKERYERTSKINREEESETAEREPTTQPVPPIQEPVEQPVQEPQQRETVPPTTNQPVQEPTTAPEQHETTPNQGTMLDPTRFIFASTEPYPEITNAYPSMYEVKLIKWLTASKDSEMSAVATYMYQSYILQDEYPLIADTLKHIAIVEMSHCQMPLLISAVIRT